MRVNAIGPGIVAAACAVAGVPLVHISTDFVFDGTKEGAYVEVDPVAPLSVYGSSKAKGEDAVRDAWREHLILRTAWLFGIYGTNFVKTMLRLAAERDEWNVVADQRGSPTSTADLARAILEAATAIAAGAEPWGTYHFAGSGETTRYDLARSVVAAQASYTGRFPHLRAVATVNGPGFARRPLNSVLDSSKFAAMFGFRAADWQDAVERTVAALAAAGG
jgi:dTDP-4-dehydrorhamnose reductase